MQSTENVIANCNFFFNHARMTLGERIKQHRVRLGYTQEKLADVLGVTRVAVAKWEKDGNPSEKTVCAMAREFGVHPGFLRYGAEFAVAEEAALGQNPQDLDRELMELVFKRLLPALRARNATDDEITNQVISAYTGAVQLKKTGIDPRSVFLVNDQKN